MTYKIDLHTHSTGSHDGGIAPYQYQKILENNTLDYVAITDHNKIDTALKIQDKLGEKIIVGEEIMTSEGEIIGLFLHKPIPAELSLKKTIQLIKDQGGVVYVPHPFETVRKGLHPEILDAHSNDIDIIEVCNGRAILQNRSAQAVLWARLNHVSSAASSDAHGPTGVGTTYTTVKAAPTRDNLASLLRQARLITDRPPLRSLLYPKYHKIRKKVTRS